MSYNEKRDKVIQGQAQADKEAVVDPHNGKVRVRESAFKGDKVILDANSEHAVQTEHGSSVDRPNPLTEALAQGTAEEQFARAAKDAKKA